MKKNILITGPPGSGKTTFLQQVTEKLRPFQPAGFFTTEIRETNIRKGFRLKSLEGKGGLLAHVDVTSPYRVGKYRVDVKRFEAFLVVISLLRPSVGLIIIDEIGKMECFSDLFRRLVRQALDSEKLVLATIALKGDNFIDEIKKREDVLLVELVESRREAAAEEIVRQVEDIYVQRKG